MNSKFSLRRRITRSFVVMAAVLAGFFTIVAYAAVEVIEAQVIDGKMQKVAGRLIAHYKRGETVEPPPDVTFFANGDIPGSLRSMPPGSHELWLNNREVQALVLQQDGNRYVIAHDMEEFEHTEFVIFTTLGVGLISSILLALMLGIMTARHVVAPVTRLARAVEEDNVADIVPSLNAQGEIEVLARAFAKRTEELRQFLQREQFFTSDVSHELRTPLTIMLGAAEMLQANISGGAARDAAIERIRRVAAETSERVSALLLLSRSPELIDAPMTLLNDLLKMEAERCQYLLVGKPVELRIQAETPVKIFVRPELAGIVIGNLIRNACQHTDEGHITVTLTRGELVVEDTGPGIPSNIRARLFERFVHDDSQSTEGTGLGLSIVKRVVEHVGWTIQHDADGYIGCRFTIRFPEPSAN
jgi:signal transduction histidine kinase